MARLAAYYQEDFYFAPGGYGTKQRKSAYTSYDTPKNNVLHNNYVNGGPRIRALASSEPSLTPTYTYAPKTAVMTLKAKPRPLNNKLIEQSCMAVERLERMYEPTQCSNPYAIARLEADAFDCESVYSQGGRSAYCETYVKQKHKSKDKHYKRNPYDLYDSNQRSTELCAVQNMDRYTSPPMNIQCVDTTNGEYFPLPETYNSNCEECIMPPVSFRSDSSHGRWQQWPWNIVDTRSPAMLSPPSPLDSGLSSQSITSSPSLDAEPVPIHPGQMQIIGHDSHHICSCPRVYSEPSQIVSSPGKYDSGRSSPGAYNTATRKSKKSARMKNEKNANNGIVYFESDFEDEYARGQQVRYGKLGLIGEPVQQFSSLVKVPNGNCQSSECVQNSINNNIPSLYYYTKDKSMTLKKCDSCPPKLSKSQTNYIGPSVIITEASDRSNPSSLDSTMTNEPENSEKSPEPESSMSTEVSNSTCKSSSDASAGIEDRENEKRRKSKRKTEKEIRELEDMYRKCNLSDNDLLERAERRDLPTAHQTKLDQSSASNLTRSKSDTFFEMFGSAYYNPYESPQRAPPFRRSGIPDIIGDDMALRKNCKPVTTAGFNPAENTMTYMLCSSHFTPTVSAGKDILLMDNPDVEYDDLSYRKHYFGKKSKIPDPQPPFGIPLRPPPPQNVYNDYLHVVPTNGLKPLCHPRGNPDVVRDDMAFRTLRKDEPERLYYDSTEVYRRKMY